MKIIEVKDYNYIDPINRYVITWELLTKCNYACNYCDIHGKDISKNWELPVNFLNYLTTFNNTKVTLFGGEPTEHPAFFDILKKLEVKKIELYTNLSKDISFYDLAISIQPNIEIEASYHPSKERFENFFKKLKYLSNNLQKLEIVYMLDTRYSNYRKEYALLKEIVSDKVSLIISKVEHSSQKKLNEKEENWYQEQQKGKDLILIYEENGIIKTKETISNYLFSNGLNSFQYFNCSCGSKNIYISHDCNVYPCLDYRKRNLDPFFNLTQGDFKENFEKIKNKNTICRLPICSSELGVPKKRVLNL